MLVAVWQLFALFMCNALFGDEEFVGNVGAADDDWKQFRQLPIVRCTLSSGPTGLTISSLYIYMCVFTCVCVCV